MSGNTKPKSTHQTDGDRLRERLERIKERLGHTSADQSIHGMDRRIAYSIRPARPDLSQLNEDALKLFVRLTLDELMYDALSEAKLDTTIMAYEFCVEINGENVVVDGSAEYRIKTQRPNNKGELETAIKRQVTLALQRFLEDREWSTTLESPSRFINKTTDALGRMIARVYLDRRINNETIGTIFVRKPKK